jgi:hypothetical protein
VDVSNRSNCNVNPANHPGVVDLLRCTTNGQGQTLKLAPTISDDNRHFDPARVLQYLWNESDWAVSSQSNTPRVPLGDSYPWASLPEPKVEHNPACGDKVAARLDGSSAQAYRVMCRAKEPQSKTLKRSPAWHSVSKKSGCRVEPMCHCVLPLTLAVSANSAERSS